MSKLGLKQHKNTKKHPCYARLCDCSCLLLQTWTMLIISYCVVSCPKHQKTKYWTIPLTCESFHWKFCQHKISIKVKNMISICGLAPHPSFIKITENLRFCTHSNSTKEHKRFTIWHFLTPLCHAPC